MVPGNLGPFGASGLPLVHRPLAPDPATIGGVFLRRNPQLHAMITSGPAVDARNAIQSTEWFGKKDQPTLDLGAERADCFI